MKMWRTSATTCRRFSGASAPRGPIFGKSRLDCTMIATFVSAVKSTVVPT